MARAFSLVALVLGALLAACGSPSTPSAPFLRASVDKPKGNAASVNYTLTTMVSGGAIGDLKTGAASYRAGRVIKYAFTAATGYSAATVVLDGAHVAVSGTLTMNANHYLWAFGNPAQGTPFTGMIVAPTDTAIIPYPQFYQKQPSLAVTVQEPYCAISSQTIAYPTAYLGAFAMPTVSGAPLPLNLLRGVQPEDVWFAGYPASCGPIQPILSGDAYMRAAFLQTIQRIKALGADHILLYQNGCMLDANAARLTISTRYCAGNFIPDSDLRWIGVEARRIGLHVFEQLQVSPTDSHGNTLPNTPTGQWLTRFLQGLSGFRLEQATIAQASGYSAISLDWGWYGPSVIRIPGYYSVMAKDLSAQAPVLRQTFKGKLFLGSQFYVFPLTPDLSKATDWFFAQIYPNFNLTPEQAKGLNVALLKPYYEQRIAAIQAVVGSNGPAVMWGSDVPSTVAVLLYGEGDAFGSCSYSDPIAADFSVQAIAQEAFLEAVASTTVKSVSIEMQKYWWWETMVAAPCPNPAVDPSFRDKPAESIVYQWFKRS